MVVTAAAALESLLSFEEDVYATTRREHILTLSSQLLVYVCATYRRVEHHSVLKQKQHSIIVA